LVAIEEISKLIQVVEDAVKVDIAGAVKATQEEFEARAEVQPNL
jgi:hypothetical protein